MALIKMKNLHILTLIVLSIILMSSCQKEKLSTYHEKSRIYFELLTSNEYTRYPGSYAKSLNITFGERPDTVLTDTLKLHLFSTGPFSETKRIIDVQLQSGLGQVTAGTDYEFINEPIEIEPGKIDTSLNIVFHRTKRIYDSKMVFGIRLVENAGFQLGPLNDTTERTKRFTDIQFRVSDIVVKPKNWDSFLAPYFLSYSATKYRFIINTLHVSQFDSKTSAANMRAFRTKLVTALQTYEIKNGKKLLDENGEEVKFN